MSKVEILTLRILLLIEQCQGPSSRRDHPRDSYAWNYREQATFLTPSESLVEGGFEPLTTGSMGKKLTFEFHPDTLRESLAEGGFEPLNILSRGRNFTTELS